LSELWLTRESQVASIGEEKFPTEVSYGNNYLQKFRKHTELLRRTTGRLEIAKVSTPEGQAQIKEVIEDIVKTGVTRQIRYMSIADALWSRKGNAIVIRQANGEFVTFLEAPKRSCVLLGKIRRTVSSVAGADNHLYRSSCISTK
jgi:hypothetical protein